MPDLSRNRYLDAPLAGLYARTALPIIFVMGMNGLLTVVDAVFLGHYVGPQALAAVTLAFPLYMLIVALSTLVAGGMSSLLARHLGARQLDAARRLYASAHWLALAAGAALIVFYALSGGAVVRLAAGGDATLAAMTGVYLQILVLFSPVFFVLSVNADALRNEGHVGFMAAMSLLVSFGNIGFDYLLIGVFRLGIAGSAYGTILAQAVALGIVLAYSARGRTLLTPGVVLRHISVEGWGGILALGAPQSLNFVGIALASTALLTALQMIASPDYAVSVSAYGIATRVMTFAFLPLLGLSQAMQTITGNNHGAGLWRRRDGSFRVAAGAALVFCAGAQAVVTLFAPQIGQAFVADPLVVAKVGVILPAMVALFVLSGPQMMVSAHFQAIGDAPRAAVLGLAKPYLFILPLTFLLPLSFGEPAIWWTGPCAELLLLGLTALVLSRRARRHALRWGLFDTSAGGGA
ncbi:MATE family efflux transporter [Salipiger sp. P9]|uniref:MATE family efflux transporter n=1 Tax=Salipiger pentaromativorans TaxID=2943193 RepID=UPI0021587889|nr:MATE family efflux transporter [Salipiger pentaromativorans]MCR8550985.1 MATE family efflux transporter [Salipiger pentaromativorans]